jgi:hypothetical protein
MFFTWRKKHTNAEIYQQYLDKVYVLKLVRQSLCFKSCFVQVLPQIRQCNLQPSMQPQLPALFSESKSVCQEGMLEWWR